MALILVPACVVIGWMLRCMAGQLDARHPAPGPLWTPEFDELEPVRESRWEDSERYYERPELPAPVTVNNYFVTGASGWPAQLPVIDYAQPANHELLP